MSINDTPRKSEAHGEQAVIEWRGHEFAVSREMDDWSVDLVEALEDGKSIGIVRGALGSRQWRVVKSEEPKLRDIKGLADDIAVALGFASAGESAASSD